MCRLSVSIIMFMYVLRWMISLKLNSVVRLNMK